MSDKSNQNTDAYVGVDPIYQNSGGVQNRPYWPEGETGEVLKDFVKETPDGPWGGTVPDEESHEVDEDEKVDGGEDEKSQGESQAPAVRQLAKPVKK